MAPDAEVTGIYHRATKKSWTGRTCLPLSCPHCSLAWVRRALWVLKISALSIYSRRFGLVSEFTFLHELNPITVASSVGE